MTDEPLRTARNIVNQLADLWQVSVPVRQSTNDMADQFVSAVINTAMCATLAELLDEERMPCRCNRCLQDKIDDLAVDGVCPNCRHPMLWHSIVIVGQLEAAHEVLVCNNGCDCRIESCH
jgi:hypothetical protein